MRARENEPENGPANAAVCPLHPRGDLQTVTRYAPLVAIMEATGDEIRFCYGSGQRCSWVHSRNLGTVVEAGVGRLDALGIEAAYYDCRAAAASQRENVRRTDRSDDVQSLLDRWEVNSLEEYYAAVEQYRRAAGARTERTQ